MTTNNNNQKLDVMREVQLDHSNVKDLIKRYKQESDHDRKSALVNTIVRELAVHSEAEEVSVYNVVDARQGKEAGQELRHQHQELEEILYSLDYTRINSPEFEKSPCRLPHFYILDREFNKAVKMFLEHGDQEEQEYIVKLRDLLSVEENDKLARDFLSYRSKVPSRPHPAAPQSGGVVQKALGLQTKLHDKVIETMTGREFARVKDEHPAGPDFKNEDFDTSVLA